MSYRIVQEYHAAKQGMSIKTGCWPNEVLSPSGLIAHFRKGLNAKISSHIPQSGRKFDPEYQRALRHDYSLVTEHMTTHVRRSGRNLLNTPEMQRRYPSVNTLSFED